MNFLAWLEGLRADGKGDGTVGETDSLQKSSPGEMKRKY